MKTSKKPSNHNYALIGYNRYDVSVKRCLKCGLNWFNYDSLQDDSYLYMSTSSPVAFTKATTEDIIACPNIEKGYINLGSYNGTR